MSQQEYWYVIGVGDEEDLKAGRGSLYYIDDKNGDKAVPVFTEPEKAEAYRLANFEQPQAHMEVLESLPESHVAPLIAKPESHVAPLTAARFSILSLTPEGVIRMAAGVVGADYLVKDPLPGNEQEILRLTDRDDVTPF